MAGLPRSLLGAGATDFLVSPVLLGALRIRPPPIPLPDMVWGEHR